MNETKPIVGPLASGRKAGDDETLRKLTPEQF